MSVVTSVFADHTFNPAVQQVKTLFREGTDQPKLHQKHSVCQHIYGCICCCEDDNKDNKLPAGINKRQQHHTASDY